jgi:citronellyl-CoA dehydrogenase
MEIECFRGAVYQVLEDRNRGEDVLLRGIALKTEGARLMERVAGECMRLHGGTDVVYETGIERYYRDAQMCHVGCGSTKTLTDYLSNFI